MTEEQVMLGAAMMLLKRYGSEAPLHVARRIGELVLEGDRLGVATWQGVAAHMDMILRWGSVQ